jgi:hypothetical protein
VSQSFLIWLRYDGHRTTEKPPFVVRLDSHRRFRTIQKEIVYDEKVVDR